MPINVETVDLEALSQLSPDLRDRVIRIFERTLEDIEYLLVNGTDEMKAPLHRALLAAMTRPTKDDRKTDARLDELRAQMVQENSDMMLALTTRDASEIFGVGPADTRPELQRLSAETRAMTELIKTDHG